MPQMTTETHSIEAAARRMWGFYAIAAIAFLPALGFYYTGEEAIMPLISLEMWFSGDWTRHALYGNDLKHNSLFNWILIALCSVVGWENMLPAARSVSIAAVIGTGLVLAWTTRRVTGDAVLGAFAAVVYLLLADVALYRGWLAYTDPLYGFFIFAASSCLWIACREKRVFLLAAAVLLISAAVLTKAFTAYVFYGTLVFVLLFDRTARPFLLSWPSIALHAGGALFMMAWFGVIVGGDGQGTRMFREIVDKLQPGSLGDYAGKLLFYPLETILKTSPAVLLAAYYGIRRRRELNWRQPVLFTAAAVALLGFLPYWLAPESHTRYHVPIYPWLALVCACVIYQAGANAVTITLRWWGALLTVKLALFLAGFPYYQKAYRGENYAVTAREIFKLASDHPLYTTNDAASGLSVAAHIAILRLPSPPLMFPPAQWDTGFVISYRQDAKLGQVYRHYKLGGNDLFLLCRGAACGNTSN